LDYYGNNNNLDGKEIVKYNNVRLNGHDINTSGGFVIVGDDGLISPSIYYTPTRYSDLEPDIIYLTEENLSSYATTGWISGWIEGKEYATTGWVEGKEYATTGWVEGKEYATTGWVEGKRYLTEHQSLSEYLPLSTYATGSGQFVLISEQNLLGDNFSLNGNIENLRINGYSPNAENGLLILNGDGKIPNDFFEETDPVFSQLSTEFLPIDGTAVAALKLEIPVLITLAGIVTR